MSYTVSAAASGGGQRLHLDAGLGGGLGGGGDGDARRRRAPASTSTCVSGSGWHSGTMSGVRLAAMIPATRATREDVALGQRAGRDPLAHGAGSAHAGAGPQPGGG